MKELIAYCGLDCEKCDARKATVNNDDVLREKVAKAWSELNGVLITKDMINCLGCRVDGVKTPYCESMCQIRLCALKNEFSSCGKCENLNGCEKIKPVIDNSNEAKINLKI